MLRTTPLLIAAIAIAAVSVAAVVPDGGVVADEDPSIETHDGEMEFRLRRDAEATFSRDRRESVTIFSLAADIGTLIRRMDVVDAAISNLPTAVSSLVTAVNAQSASINRIDDVVSQVAGAQSAADALKIDLAAVKGTLETVRDDVKDLDSVKIDVAAVKGDVSSVKSEIGLLETAIKAAADASKQQAEDALAAAKTATDNAIDAAIGEVSSGETTYVNWNRHSCNGGATTLFKGYTWGNHHDHRGGTNPICMKDGDNTGQDQQHGSLDQMHYIITDHCGGHTSISPCNRPVACALCSIKKSCYMETGTGSCSHPDYQTVYKGWLFGGHYSHQAQTERICLDEQGQYPAQGSSGAYIYPVATQNGFAGRSGGRTVVCNWCCQK